MPISAEQLKSIISNSKNIIDKAETIKPTKQSNMNENYSYNDSPVSFSNIPSYENEDYYEKPEELVRQQEAQRMENRQSKMPSAIRESILNNPISTDGLQNSVGATSILDKIGIERQRQNINANNNLSENSLKGLIKECIKEVISDSDNSLRTIQLSSGKIRLVDNSGRIFVANLEYKGNVNDNKKK